jgi:hypothetical protein
MPESHKARCLYCSTISTRSKEHLIPAALGTKEYIRKGVAICGKCNNGTLSKLDNELCTKSFLSMIASRELEKNLCNLWAIEESNERVFIEAYPVWNGDVFQRFVPFPQIVFTSGRPRFYLDGNDVLRHDTSDVMSLLTRLVKKQFSIYKVERKACHFEKVPNSLITSSHEFPPRVLFRKTFAELAESYSHRKKQSSLIFRYLKDLDLKKAMIAIDALDSPNKLSNQWDRCRLAKLNRVGVDYDVCLVFRALLKIGLHLIHHVSRNNDISSNEYTMVRDIITGKRVVREEDLVYQGFISTKQFGFIFDDAPKNHQFLIQNCDGIWTVISSFFSKSIGTCVRFKGRNRDFWNSVLVKVGYGKDPPKIAIEDCSLIHPTDSIFGTWVATREFLPDFPWITKELSLSLEKRVKNPRRSGN